MSIGGVGGREPEGEEGRSMERLDLTPFNGHTPGPWMPEMLYSPQQAQNALTPYVLDGQNRNIAAALNGDPSIGRTEHAANLFLVSAAPALLAALRDAYATLDRLTAERDSLIAALATSRDLTDLIRQSETKLRADNESLITVSQNLGFELAVHQAEATALRAELAAQRALRDREVDGLRVENERLRAAWQHARGVTP